MTGNDTLSRLGKGIAVTAVLAACYSMLFLGTGRIASAQFAEQHEDIALSLATLLRAARTVVSEGQALINDPNIGDKGFTSDYVLDEARFNYEIETGRSLDSIPAGTLHGRLIAVELRAIAAVVDDWQEVINRPGVGYKGFLPAIFAGQTAQRFGDEANDQAEIKLTAPVNYVRNPVNMPDSWEAFVLESELGSTDHPYGRAVHRRSPKDGRPALRLMLPEYYSQAVTSMRSAG